VFPILLSAVLASGGEVRFLAIFGVERLSFLAESSARAAFLAGPPKKLPPLKKQ
jgi:hypothetical protein